MDNDNGESDESLRRLVEERVRRNHTTHHDLSAAEVDRLVYELEIHQEELRIQNEELRRALIALEESRDRYVDLYDFAPVGYLTLNARGEVVEANLTICQMLGCERSKVIGMRFAMFCDVDSREEFSRHLDEVFATDDRLTTQLRIDREAECLVDLESHRASGQASDDRLCRTIISDITARRQAERAVSEKNRQLELETAERYRAEDRLREQENQLAHFARVTTMGEMLASIAHEINQPLAAIANFASACELKLEQEGRAADDEVRLMMHRVTEQAHRSGEIIRGLRGFVRTSDANRSVIVPGQVIDESMRLMIGEARRRGITLTSHTEENLPLVLASRIQLQQVLVNLVKNAFEALLSVEGERTVSVHARALDNAICVSVDDTGPGLSPEISEVVFDAFKSTKEDGMGMGLAISRSIVETHGGKIEVASRSPVGTSFQFTLPGVAEAVDDRGS